MLRRLPSWMREFFWDVDFPRLQESPAEFRDFILKRLLACGNWRAWKWLRRHVPPAELRAFLERTRGRGIEAQRLMFYAVILGIPYETVASWVRERQDPWSRRHAVARQRSS